MKNIWYVLDVSEGQLSWSASAECSESFASLRAAEKRAASLANLEPGKTFAVLAPVSQATAPVSPAKIQKV